MTNPLWYKPSKWYLAKNSLGPGFCIIGMFNTKNEADEFENKMKFTGPTYVPIKGKSMELETVKKLSFCKKEYL